ncbi:MAG: hypothetical protein B7Y90_09065 [Alphaproteobacteria bacterium 32-64-14]|nr:MAG: hypothetical protein B7Y90_09065 [Alphaproteobacteria bacterium 32-64-14]
MDFGEREFEWITELVRSHRESIQQLESLPAADRGNLSAQLARRQLVLGSDGFVKLTESMSAYQQEISRYRNQAEHLSPEALKKLEQSMVERLAAIREKIASIKYLLTSA